MIRNHWYKTIELGDVWKSDIPYPEKREIIVERIQKSGWAEDNSVVAGLLEQISQTEGIEEFDFLWDQVYDEADWDRVWIDTF